jgi:hypothetical protein
MTHPVHAIATGLLGLSLVTAAVAVSPVGATQQRASSKALNGTFKLKAGRYSGGKASGTYFRMLYPGGKKFFPNPDSKAADKTYILGTPGKDGGLVTGAFQTHPDPAFDGKGNARANRILKPGSFTGIRFTAVTLKKDPQSGASVPAPSASVSGSKLSVRLPGYTVEWNKQSFNQGAPKPDGSGAAARGTYSADSKRFVFQWTSKIVGGPFDGFSGFWHFEGTFSPR